MRNLGKMGVALAVAVVFLTSDVMSKPRPCLQENNEYYNSHLGCHKCDPCPPGEEPDYDQDVPVDRKRGALRCSACRPCQPGTYSKKASRQRCSLCRNCEVLSRHTNQPCTATQNAVCGKCLPGHHDVYKRKYNSSLPQYDKACQSCNDTAHKTVPECASTTLPTVREEEGRTYHNANVDKEALVISENSQDSAFSAALTSDVMSKPRPCLQENNEYYNSHLGCHKCDPCPPGEEPDYDQDVPVDRKRGALRCSACRPCQPGTYSKKPSRQRCNLCRNCEALSRHTNQPCTATQNAVCGKCLPGHHDVYKRKYNSSLPQYDKACQSCNDTAHKTAQECASTTLPTVREQEERTYHNANVGKEEPVISENPQDSAFHMTVVTGMPYVMAIVLVLLVIAVAVFMRKSITSRRQKTPNLEVELGKLCPVFPGEKSGNPRHEGNPNSSYVPREPLRQTALKVADRGSKAPLLPLEVTTDGEDFTSKKSVASMSNYRVIQKRIGREWKDLARALTISDPDIEKLEMDHPDTRERIYQLLLLWERRSESEALLGHLCSALQSIERHDVAIELLQTSDSYPC